MTPVKIGFVLLSNSKNPIPSTRIAVLNMFPFLRKENFDPHIVYEPEEGNETPDLSNLAPRLIEQRFQIIFFQKVHGASVEQLVRELSNVGIKTIYGVCDLINESMVKVTDATIIVTDYLKSLYPANIQDKISVVHDGIEHPEIHKTTFTNHPGSKTQPLHAVLVTSAYLDRLPMIDPVPNWLKVTIMGRYPPLALQRFNTTRWQFGKQRNMTQRMDFLRFLMNPQVRCVTWDPVHVYELLQQADIGIIPIETSHEDSRNDLLPLWKVKSENRLTMKMCIGLPIIASTIPSYQPVIEQGCNGFLANSKQEWLHYLQTLRDPELRFKVGNCARESVLIKYSKENQSRLLISVIKKLI